jgi:hypothetical protein
MKVKLQDIIDAVDFDSDLSQSFLNKKTGEVCVYSDEELQAAENNEDLSDSPQWYREAVNRAKQYFENENDYLPLPEKYDFNEYRVMERFIAGLPVEEQVEILFRAIKGKGAFHRFKNTLERFALVNQWYEYKEMRLRQFVEDWCEENNIET